MRACFRVLIVRC